jgi:hypothetical protein
MISILATMGFLDRFKKKGGDQPQESAKSPDDGQTERRVKRYTSDGNPIYE